MSIFFLGHVYATRLAPLYFNINFDYSFAAFTMYIYPVGFTLYYALFGAAAVYHWFYGATRLNQYFKLFPPIPSSLKPGSTGFKILTGIGALGAVSSVLALGGYYWDIPFPRILEIERYARLLVPDMFYRTIPH